jgi:succinoglycan biosynthesis transport protein ExoP
MSEMSPVLTSGRDRSVAMAGARHSVSSGRGGPAPHQTLTGLLRILRTRWKLGVATGVAVFALGVLICFMIRSYSATTIVEINRDDPGGQQPGVENGAALTSDEVIAEVQTDLSVLESDDNLALSVIDKLHLLSLRSFQKVVDPSEAGRPLSQAPRTRDKVLKLFRSHLKVTSPVGTRLITITYKSSDPVLASEITNTFAKAFIDDTLSRRQHSIVDSTEWMHQELAELRQRMEDSQQKLVDYERNTGLAGVQVTGAQAGNGNATVSVSPQNTVTGRLLDLNQELTTAEANRISAEAINRLVRTHNPEVVLGLGSMAVATRGGEQNAIPPESVALISNLRAQEADLDRQLAAADVKYGEKNPRRIQLQQQRNAIATQIEAEMFRIRSRAANNYQYAKLNEDAIRAKFHQQESAANDMADKTVRLQMLAQEAFSNQTLYENLYSKLQGATLASATRATRIDIVSEAIPAGIPSTPRWGLYLAADFALSLFLGMTACFVRESFDQTVRTPDDLESLHGVTLPGYIPRLQAIFDSQPLPGRSPLIEFPRSPFAEAFRALRTEVLCQLPSSSTHTILVTSALRGAGKTTVSYNLAVALAQHGERVLLVDADMRNPTLHRIFPCNLSPGLSDACMKDVPVDAGGGARHPFLPNLFMMPAGTHPDLPSELLGSQRFEEVLKRVSTGFNYVIIDSPPILSVTDASVLASKVDAIISVVRSRRTTRLELAALMKVLHRSRAPILTFVMNDVRHPAVDGFYTYHYPRTKEDQLAAHV